MNPKPQTNDPHEPGDLSPSLHLIIEIYGDLNELIRRIGYDVTVTISGVPRRLFKEIMDYSDGFFDGHLVADDPLRPLWVKRFQENVAIYTREPPKGAASRRVPDPIVTEEEHQCSLRGDCQVTEPTQIPTHVSPSDPPTNCEPNAP